VKPKTTLLLTIIFGAVVTFYFFTINNKNITGKFDIVDKENDKIGILFEQELEKEKGSIGHGFYSGLMPSCTLRIDGYLKTIKYIETYASKGTESSDKFNQLRVKITFNDNKVISELYTGIRVMQALGMGAQLLMKLELVEGKVVKAYSNGVEKADSPQNIKNDLRVIINAILNYDKKINSSLYYYANKTNDDIKKEWDDVK
jgi:hypothetical protein